MIEVTKTFARREDKPIIEQTAHAVRRFTDALKFDPGNLCFIAQRDVGVLIGDGSAIVGGDE